MDEVDVDDVDVDEVGVDLKAMLELQLSEVEMLASMFPSPGEFTLDSQFAVADIQAFLDGKVQYQYLRSRIGFTIRIAADGNKVCVVMVTRCVLLW